MTAAITRASSSMQTRSYMMMLLLGQGLLLSPLMLRSEEIRRLILVP